jgi:hypothetical protein
MLAPAALLCGTLPAFEQDRTAAEKPPGFLAGAAVADITPPLGASLDGIIMRQGPVEHIHDNLHARALVLDDGTTRLAIVVCEVCMIPRELLDRAKDLAHERTGIPASHMLVSATHTHSAPRIGCGTGELDEQYYSLLTHRIADTITCAAHRLAPAKAGWGVGSKPEFTENRRWFVQPGKTPINPFDSKDDQVLMYANRKGSGVKPAGPVDPEVAVLSVQHADGSPLALIANYNIHYVTSMGRQVSADYCGLFAKRVEERLGSLDSNPPFVAMMSNGTFGDTGGVGGGGYDKVQEVAFAVADEALHVYNGIVHQDGLTLAVCETERELGIRRPDAERLAWAKEVLAGPPPTKDQHRWRTIYAQQQVELNEWPPTVKLKLQAFRIGGLGIAAIPCEPFAETGLAIKDASPLKPTFTVGLANGYNGYLPTPRHHALGGYETWTGRGSYLEVDAEPKIRAALLDLLGQVAASAHHPDAG